MPSPLTPSAFAQAVSQAVIDYNTGVTTPEQFEVQLQDLYTSNNLSLDGLALGVSNLVMQVKGWMRYGPVASFNAGATVDLGSAASHIIEIAGDTNISSFGASATTENPIYEVKLTGSPMLVYNAVSMILPGGVDIQGAPGDTFLVEALGASKFKVWFYFRSNGTIVGSGLGTMTAYGFNLWSELEALSTTGLTTGIVAKVYGPDAATHTDPITAATVNNVGIYSYRTGVPSGWKRVANLGADDTLPLEDALTSLSTATTASIASVEDAEALGVGAINAARDEGLTAINDAAADIGVELAVAASARVFDTKTNLLAACSEGEAGWIPQSFGVKAEGFMDKSGVAISTGKTMLLGSGSTLAITWEMLQSPVISGAPPSGAYIDIDFGDLAFTDGRVAQNLLAECPPTTFTLATDQAVTTTANAAGVLNVWEASPLIEDTSIELWFTATEGVTAAANGTITISILQATDAALTTPDTIYTHNGIAKADFGLGTVVKLRVPMNLLTKQYLGAKYTVTNGPLTAGKLTFVAYAFTGKPPLSFLVFNKPEQLRNQGSGPTIATAMTGAARGVTFTANQTLTLHDNYPVVPTGEKWWMELIVAGGVGSGGGQQLRYGDPETYQTTPALAEGVFQKLSFVFDGSGTRLPRITTTAGGTANVLFQSIRIGPGGVVPDAAERHQGHAYGSFCARGRLERVGLNNRKKTTTGNRVTITRNPGLARSTHSQKAGLTIFAAVYIPSGSGGNDIPIITPIYDSFGSPTISSATFSMMLDNFQGTVGELSIRPNQAASRVTGYHEPRPGWHIMALRRRQTSTYFETSLWMDGAPCLRFYDAPGDIQLMGYWLGAYASTMNHAPSTFVSNVSYGSFVEVPRGLSDDEMLAEFTRQRAKLALKGISLSVDQYAFVAMGTSRTAWDSLPSWAWRLALTRKPLNADGSNRFNYFNCANGGMSYRNVLATKTPDTVANSGLVRTSNVLTIKTTTAHARSVGEFVTLWGCSNPTLDGTYAVASIPTSTTFTVASTGPDLVAGGGVLTPHRDDHMSVFNREVKPILRGLKWAGTRAICFLPDLINDYANIRNATGNNSDYAGGAGTPDPAGWNVALPGWQNVLNCYVIPLAQAIRAEMAPDDQIWSYDAMVRTDSTGTTSGYMPDGGGRDSINAYMRSAAFVGPYVNKHIDFLGTGWENATTVTANGYLGGDGLHDSSAGGLAMADVILPHITDLP